jgi:hypothetical protein
VQFLQTVTKPKESAMPAHPLQRRFTRRALTAAVIAACATSAAPAFAMGFTTESGWEGNIKNDLSITQSWRMEDQHKDLIGPAAAVDHFSFAGSTYAAKKANAIAAGYTANGGSSNLNYDKGDRYSTLLKIITEVSMSKGEMGGMLRAKAWYDDALNNHDVKYGNQPNQFNDFGTHKQPLSDKNFPSLNRFEGAALMDAYVYNTWQVGGNPLQVRLGRQAVNWGESIFILGANQLSPIDASALNKAGTQIKEALMPVWAITANTSFQNGLSVEGFYQFKWEPYNLDTCGTYMGGDGGTDNPGACDIADPAIDASSRGAQQVGTYIPFVNPHEPKDSGQWGVALRFPVESIDTEFGLYAMNFHSRVPYLSGNVGGNVANAMIGFANTPLSTFGGAATLAGLNPAFNTQSAYLSSVANGGFGLPMTSFKGLAAYATSGIVQGLAGNGINLDAADQATLRRTLDGVAQTEAFYEFPEDIKYYAISASTTIAGWSVGAEVSHSPNYPVQLAAGDFLYAVVEGSGPFGTNANTGGNGLTATGSTATNTLAPNTGTAKGWERTDKTQIQINALSTLRPMLGASGGLVIGEVGFQWAGIENSNGTNKRYGRNFLWSAGQHASYGGLGKASGGPGYKNDGYMTDYSWGYRMMGQLTYPGMFGTGWEFRPSVFWSHDVEGNSIDYQFLEDRKTLSLTAGFSLNNQHMVELNYTTYDDSAKYHTFRDHDNASVVYRYTF